MTALPTGTVTFLFTDIENSTQLWEQHPDWMAPAFARQEALIRGAVAAHDGRGPPTALTAPVCAAAGTGDPGALPAWAAPAGTGEGRVWVMRQVVAPPSRSSRTTAVPPVTP